MFVKENKKISRDEYLESRIETMNPELFITWRYLVTKRKEKFISLISVISVLGIAIGVMALIVVLAVMTGFDKDLREKIVGNYSHITVSGYRPIVSHEYETIFKKILASPHVSGASPNVLGQVLVKESGRFFAVALRGIEPETAGNVINLEKYLVSGKLSDLKQGGVIIGKELALYLGAVLDSDLSIYSPTGKKYSLKICGIFNSGMYDYDMNLVFADLGKAQEIIGSGSAISSISIKLDNLYLADKVKEGLVLNLGMDYVVKTWMETNQNFFAALKLEKLSMFIILTLIILVASFNIISTLIVLVVDKTKDIGILKAIGMNASQIRNIFTYQGIIIGGLGTLLGGAGGILLCAALKKYQFIKLPQDIYYISRLPVSIQLWPDIVLITVAAMLITLVSTIYPAIKAARFKIVDALRYE